MDRMEKNRSYKSILNDNIAVKILQFCLAFLPYLPPLPHSAHRHHAKKTAPPAGPKNRMDYLFFILPVASCMPPGHCWS